MPALRNESKTPSEPRKPRYAALADEISQAIGSGDYAVGGLLPSEAALCARYRVSRHTVREAIRILQGLGLVSRHQGLGTRIQSAQVASRYVQAMDAIPDLWEYVKNTKLTVVRRSTVKAREAATPLPASEPGRAWRLIEAVRSMKSGEPIAWKQVYIDSAYGAAAADIGKQRVPIYSLIEKRYGIKTVKVRQEISAVAIPAVAARALNVKAGASGLEILRHYLDENERVFEVTLSIYPAGRFRYSVELRLEYGNDRR
jgi:GntR family transcriptional regulator